MESNSPPPESSKDNPEDKDKKKKSQRGPGHWDKWLFNEGSPDYSNTLENYEEVEKPKTKLQQLWDKVMDGLVELRPEKSEKSEDQSAETLQDEYIWGSDRIATPTPDVPDITEPALHATDRETYKAEDEQRTNPLYPEIRSEKAYATEKPLVTDNTTEVPPELPQDDGLEDQKDFTESRQTIPPSMADRLEPIRSYDREQGPSHEVIKEKASSQLAIIALIEGYRTRREQKRQAKRVKRMEKEIKNNQLEMNKLQKEGIRQNTKLKNLASPETVPVVSENIGLKPPEVVRNSHNSYNNVEIATTINPETRSKVVNNTDIELKADSGETRSEPAYEAISKTLEKDEPLERSYELRHEVVGSLGANDSTPSRSSYTAGSNSAPVNYDYASSSQKADMPRLNQLPSHRAEGRVYQQATKNGFLAAVVILVFVILAYIFIRL